MWIGWRLSLVGHRTHLVKNTSEVMMVFGVVLLACSLLCREAAENSSNLNETFDRTTYSQRLRWQRHRAYENQSGKHLVMGGDWINDLLVDAVNTLVKKYLATTTFCRTADTRITECRCRVQRRLIKDRSPTVTPVYTARVHGRPVSTTRVNGPSWRVSKNAPEFTGHGPSTRPVNSGRELG